MRKHQDIFNAFCPPEWFPVFRKIGGADQYRVLSVEVNSPKAGAGVKLALRASLQLTDQHVVVSFFKLNYIPPKHVEPQSLDLSLFFISLLAQWLLIYLFF